MSINLYLKACREVFSKSGVSSLQTENIDLYQTPTKVTDSILSYPSFEEQLNAYCSWVDEIEVDSNENFDWVEIYDSAIRSKEFYIEEKCSEFSDEQIIVKVVIKGEPEFEEILTINSNVPYHSKFGEHIGYCLIAPKPHSQIIFEKVQKLRQEKYKFEFYAM
jgi:hypothetical protein